MPRRKHTRCGGCRQVVFCRELEVMWRLDGAGPWTWIDMWTCAACRSSNLQLLADMGSQYVLWDG